MNTRVELNIKYRFDLSLNLFIERFEGRIDRDGIMEWVKKISEEHEYKPGMNLLTDMSDCQLEIDFQGMHDFCTELLNQPNLKVNRLAVIAPEPLQFGISRMYQMLVEESDIHREMRIFSSLSEACEWLGLPGDFDLGL